MFLQLYRSHDDATSEPIEFRYKPIDTSDGNRKRPRSSSSGYDTDISGVSGQSPQHCSQSNYHVQQNNEKQHHEQPNPKTTFEELFAIMPELNKVEYNPKCNQIHQQNKTKLVAQTIIPICFLSLSYRFYFTVIAETIDWIVNDCKNPTEHSALAKDCVSDEAADEENSQNLLNKIEKFVLKFLEIPLLNSCNADEPKFHIARKLCAHVFERIIFDGCNTVIHLCVKSNDRPLMKRLLETIHKFELDDLLNVRNYNQETCTHLACAMNNVRLLQKMLDYGADVNVLDWIGNTPLHVAIENVNDDCVSALLNTTSTSDCKINIDLSVFNDSGYTPLLLAAMKNNLNVVEMLTHKAIQTQCLSIFDDMDIKQGQNALHIAIESKAQEVAEYLIKNECIRPLKMNRSGHTAVDVARSVNAMHLVNLMGQYAGVNDECLMNNNYDYGDSDNDASSDKESSVDLQDTNKVK